MTYDEWLAWWGDDLPRRGRKADRLVMCRFGDCGPYAVGNIYKDTLAGNTSTMRQRRALALLQREIDAERRAGK